MKNPLITIGVCVYNGEAYLCEALNSIYQQGLPLEYFEVICVDDCSKDSSVHILQEYAAKYPNMTCILHDTNKKTGTGCAEILANARGKYFALLGQDDLFQPMALKQCLAKCEEENLDVVCFNYNRVDSQNEVLRADHVFRTIVSSTGKEFIHTYYADTFPHYLLGYEWRALYRLSYLREQGIDFTPGVIYEDTTFMFKAIYYAERFGTIDDFLYNYRVNDASITDVSKKHRAPLIFEFAFVVGNEVLDLSKELSNDVHISFHLYQMALWYFKSFVFKVIAMPCSEKKKFYHLVKENQRLVRESVSFLPYYVRILSLPCVGLVLTTLLKPIYYIKRMITNKQSAAYCP